MKKIIIIGCVALVLIFGGAGALAFFLLGGNHSNDSYFEQSGDADFLKAVMKGARSEDWHTFFQRTAAEGQVVSVTIEKQRFINMLGDPKSGDYNMGEVNVKMTIKDLRKDMIVLDKTYSQSLPTVVLKQAGKSAQELAYDKAERELKELLVVRMKGAVYPAMLNYQEQKETFMPIMEARIQAPESHIRFSAGRAMLQYGDDAVPGITRAAFKNPDNDTVCAALIKELKDVKATSIPKLETLLTHSSKTVRGSAITVLTRFITTDESAKAAVIKAVKGSDHYVQQKVLEALKEAGPAASEVPETFELLMELMLNGKKGNNWRASKALCALGRPAYPTLIKALEHQELHDQLRDDLLRETPEDQMSDLLPPLLVAWKSGTTTQKAGAEKVLKRWPGSGRGYYVAMTTAAGHKNRNLRKAALEILIETAMENSARRRTNPMKKEVAETLAEFLDDTDRDIQNTAVEALLSARHSVYGAKPRDKAILIKLRTASIEEQKQLIKNLRSDVITRQNLPIFFRMVVSPDDAVGSRAADILMGNRDLQEIIVPRLAELLPRTAYAPRSSIIRFLSQNDQYAREYLPDLLAAAWEPQTKKYISTTSLVSRTILDAKHLPRMKRILVGDAHERVKQSVVQLLLKQPDKGIPLTEFFVSNLASGKMAGTEGYLFHFFKDQGDAGLEGVAYCMGADRYTSGHAYRHLKRLGKPKVVPILKKVHAKTTNDAVKEQAAKLMKEL